jgi:hypothetical protein
MGGACGTDSGRGERHTGFWWGNLKERGHVEDVGIDGRVILKWILRKWDAGMDLSCVAQARNRWPAVVKAVMNLWIAQNAENIVSSCRTTSFSRRSLLHGVNSWCHHKLNCVDASQMYSK